MGKLRLIPDKDKVGCYYHDTEGNHYATITMHNFRGKKCCRCNSWRTSGYKRAKTALFWCDNCALVLDANMIREVMSGILGGYKVAELATDKEVISIVNLHDKIAELHNEALGYETMKKNIIKSILSGG